MQIKMYIGQVVEAGLTNPEVIRVSMLELSPYATGVLKPGEKTISFELSDPTKDVKQTGSVTASNTLEAKWMGEPGLTTPPRVRKGESVYLYEVGSAGDYKWGSIGRHENLRDTDVWSLYVSAKPSRDAEGLNAKNAYGIMIDTENKHLSLSTSGANDEKATYQVSLNGGDGTASMSDNHGNEFKIGSEEHRLSLSNKDGSVFMLDGPDIIMNAKRDVLIGGMCSTFETSLLKFLGSGGDGCTQIITKGMSIKTGAFTVTATTIGLNGQVTTTSSIIANGAVQAAGFSTGTGVPGYGSVTVNQEKRSGVIPKATANSPTEDPDARHSAAQEDLVDFNVQTIAALEKLAALVGGDVSVETAAMTSAIEHSKMLLNKGQ